TFDDNNILGTSLPADWAQLCGSEDMCDLVDSSNYPGGVFVSGLMSPNFDGSWMLGQTEQQSLQLGQGQQQEVQQVHTPQSLSLSNSPSDNESNISSNPDDQIRAQTPGPLHKTIIPNYLTIRRRSLSADNIHALAKAQQQVANRKVLYPAQQHTEQISFDRTGLPKSTVSPSTMSFEQMQFFQNTKQQGVPMQDACVVKVENQNGNQISSNDSNECDPSGLHQQNNSRTSSPSLQTAATAPVTHRPHLSRSVSHQQIGPINHVQRRNELQARFKVKLDKRNQRSMPNIQLAAAAHGSMIQSSSSVPLKTNSSGGSVSGAVPIMEISSLSTPTTPTFPNEKVGAAKPTQTLAPPPRRGHMRKRSLSAPTAPFPNIAQPLPTTVSLQSTTTFPLNMYNRSRPNALPIQIQRNPKHSHTTTTMSSEEYQRKLDEELEKVDFDDITVSELKEMLRQRGKPATGKKAVLMQRLQEEVEYVKAMKNNGNQQLKNNNTQFSQMVSSPTSPSGVSLQRSIANLHISSPPTHSRRFSPYGSVSIPGSPRMMPSGLGNGRSGFSGGNVTYSEGEEWQYNIGMQPLMSHNIDEQSHSMMMMGPQSQQSQDMYGQQPSSAPPTTTEFGPTFQQPSSSASSMATEFVDFMNPISMNLMSIGPDMMRLNVSDSDESLLKETDTENKSGGNSTDPLVSSTSNDAVTGMLAQQTLEFGFNSQHQLQGEHMMIKSEDFLNYSPMSAQHIPMQLELQQQDGMSFGGW
ncbi:4238_t:CDS:2, partial [Acaulospora colombiana]